MRSTKALAVYAVRTKFINAQDNLLRAEAAFENTDLREEHGHSGKTRHQILIEYKKDVEAWQRVMVWVKAQI